MRRALPSTAPGCRRSQALRALSCALGLSLLGHGGLIWLYADDDPAAAGATGGAAGPHTPEFKASMQTRPLQQAPPAPQPTQPTQAISAQRAAPQAGPGKARPEALVQAPARSNTRPAAALTSMPSGEWHYQLSQQGREGLAVLRWDLQADGAYTLSLERELDGRPLPGWRSQGRLEPEGLAPQRFVQTQKGRERSALNFRREEGLLSFSASDDLLPLDAGLQDRLSWWMQLASLAQSQPERFRPGHEIALRVAGLRGQPHDWIFAVLPLESGAAGPLLHLRRQAINEYSGEVHLWLDPARHYLPIRVLFQLPDARSWSLQLLPSPPGENSAPDSREAP